MSKPKPAVKNNYMPKGKATAKPEKKEEGKKHESGECCKGKGKGKCKDKD
jgi:hypothetical protein